MKLLKVLAAGILLLSATVGFSQNPKTISGIVTGASDGEPIVGAHVLQAGTKNGVMTDLDGRFTIKVSLPCELTISSISYQTTTVKADGNSIMKIVLKDDSTMLENAVVTALGIKRETKALGYAVEQVNSEELNGARPINAMDALAGKVAGVDISATTAGPSGSTRIVIRGNGELSGNNQPLYVVDGVPMDNSNLGQAGMWGGYDLGDGLSSINPEDIASISILKGASAAALYGSRASNGVILITTKSAGKKKFNIDFSSSMDFVTQLSKFDDYQRVYGAGRNGELPLTVEVGRGISQSAWGAKLNKSLNGYIFDGRQMPYTNVADNISSFFRTGSTVTNSLSMSTSEEKSNLLVSLSDMRNKDIVPSSRMNRSSIMIKTGAELFKGFKIESRVNYSLENVKNRPALSDSPNNVGLSLIGLAPNIDQKWLGESYQDEYGKYVDWNGGNIYRINPYWSINKMSNSSKKDRVMGYLLANYQIIDGLSAQLRAGTDFYKFRMTDFNSVDTPIALQGSMTETTALVNETNVEGILRYDTKIGKDFDLSAFAGGNFMFFDSEYTANSGSNQIIPGMESITNYIDTELTYWHTRKQVRSAYGAVNLGWKGLLYFDFTLRNDWSSTLRKGNNSYRYPSLSGSFVFSSLLKDNSVLSFGKFRASWAEVGGDTDPYQLNLNYGVLPYTLNGMPLGNISSESIPNMDLKPTRTYSYEFGLDMKFFNRIGMDLTWYSSKTKNQIMSLPISSTTGFSTAMINSGEISNNGIELALNADLIKAKDFLWSAHLNFARNINKVVSLHPELKEYPLAEARWAGAMIEAVEGEAFGAILGKKLRRNPAGEVIYGSNGFPLVGDKLEVLGNGVYDWTAGVGTTVSWKGFTLNTLFDIKWGADVYSMSDMMATGNGTSERTLEGRAQWYASEEQRKAANVQLSDWTPTGGFIGKGVVNVGTEDNPVWETNNTPVDPQKYWAYFQSAGTPEPFIYDASFIKLRELTLSYSINRKWLSGTPLSGASISVYGRNLWTLYSNIPNVDPESSYNNGNGQGFEYGSLPSRRAWGFSVRLSF